MKGIKRHGEGWTGEGLQGWPRDLEDQQELVIERSRAMLSRQGGQEGCFYLLALVDAMKICVQVCVCTSVSVLLDL
jgi:hypothetical protein